MFVKDWLEIHRDLGSCIARGGKLSDLRILGDEVPDHVVTFIYRELGDEMSTRLKALSDDGIYQDAWYGAVCEV